MEVLNINKQLCPKCKTGIQQLLLDPLAPECPYLWMHDGKNCTMFVCINEEKNQKMERMFKNLNFI